MLNKQAIHHAAALKRLRRIKLPADADRNRRKKEILQASRRSQHHICFWFVAHPEPAPIHAVTHVYVGVTGKSHECRNRDFIKAALHS